MASLQSSGSQLAVINTIHTLTTITSASPGSYVMYVDASNLSGSDVLILRVNTKVVTSGTTREIFRGTYAGVQDPPILASIPITAINGCSFSLQQTAGTGRTFLWEVDTL